ncbi:Aste57867_21685 [Aphanomyces stellatus]|uniref:Aste57867_21685 protein n=1 Tax=Aphanomyces stellatus TaxID=120398 RepID=A0A485LJI0_9STRA|nr:hypothetical protein As57867_021616 [Aphanomyces stellatus]VFT98354.1 Aste57867_21685 [Aphanomyces stellatus]
MASRTKDAHKFLRGSSGSISATSSPAPQDLELAQHRTPGSTTTVTPKAVEKVKTIDGVDDTLSKESPPQSVSQCRIVFNLVTGSYLHLLLLLMPVAAYSYFAQWGDIPIFVLNFLAMMPLANILGEATEELAEHCGDTIGGLINATFGNAVEVIIAVFALREGQIPLVQSSLLGSILSNLLLVLGCCFIAGHMGGVPESTFSGRAAATNMSLLFVTSFAMLVPTYYQYTNKADSKKERKDEVLLMSRVSAIFLIAMYVQLLVFQLYTHRTPPSSSSSTTDEKDNDDNGEEDAATDTADVDDAEDEPQMSFWASLLVLAVSTAFVSVHSQFLVGSVEGFTKHANVSSSFVGIILLPIVGNAVEHVTAIKVAFKNNMELALGVAVGSAAQISLFVVPFCVVTGWIMGQPMSLAFTTFEAVTYVVSVVIVYTVISNGTSNWLEGCMLLTLYSLIGVALLLIDIDTDA